MCSTFSRHGVIANPSSLDHSHVDQWIMCVQTHVGTHIVHDQGQVRRACTLKHAFDESTDVLCTLSTASERTNKQQQTTKNRTSTIWINKLVCWVCFSHASLAHSISASSAATSAIALSSSTASSLAAHRQSYAPQPSARNDWCNCVPAFLSARRRSSAHIVTSAFGVGLRCGVSQVHHRRLALEWTKPTRCTDDSQLLDTRLQTRTFRTF